MALTNFREYLNSKGKTTEKAEDIMDLKLDKSPDAPEKYATHGKNYAFSTALDSKPLPYQAKTINVFQGKDDESGLGFFGTPGIDYTDTRTNIVNFSELKEHCGCESKKAPFVVAYSSGSFHPDPIQAIKYIVYLTNENENILKALMHEARKMGCLEKYTDYLTKFPEVYRSLGKRYGSDDGIQHLAQKIGSI